FEIQTGATVYDSASQFFWIRRAKNPDCILGCGFHRNQQSFGRGASKLVAFINDDDALSERWCNFRSLNELTNIFDLTVSPCVVKYNVRMTLAKLTASTLAALISGLAIHSRCKDLSEGGFAATSVTTNEN